jgi:AraC-like DNA-binding protein
MSYISYIGGYSNEKFNLHKHDNYELVAYSSGNGKLNIEGQVCDAQKGMIVVMPPNVVHGSMSLNNLRYIAIQGKSDELMHIDTPIIFNDNEREEGLSLLQMIFANRFESQEYFNSLCLSFIHYALKNVKTTNEIEKTIKEIKRQMISTFHDSDFDVTKLLKQSGYAEDYIRAHFKKITGKTPVEYLNELRINHAKTLINIYQNSTPLIDISLNCGFDDYIYFSRKFKQIVGVSPATYKKSILAQNKK